MKKTLLIAGAALALISCNMKNPLLTESTAPFGAPEFDKIKNEHYLPAFEQGIAEAKAEIDAIVANQEEPTFENTIEAMEYAGQTLSKVASIFYAVMEAHTDDEKQQIAEQISPMLTEYSMYVSLNNDLFQRVKAVYEKKDELGLDDLGVIHRSNGRGLVAAFLDMDDVIVLETADHMKNCVAFADVCEELVSEAFAP